MLINSFPQHFLYNFEWDPIDPLYYKSLSLVTFRLRGFENESSVDVTRQNETPPLYCNEWAKGGTLSAAFANRLLPASLATRRRQSDPSPSGPTLKVPPFAHSSQ